MILHTQHRKQQTYLMEMQKVNKEKQKLYAAYECCLLYTSDAADE